MKKAIPLILMMLMFSFPFLSFAKLVPDCGKGQIYSDTDKENGTIPEGKYVGDFVNGNCDFDQLITIVNKVIDFLLFTFATPLAAMAFCYAGFLLVTSGGNSEKMSKAKSIIGNVLLGYVIALSAWIIVKTILTAFGFNGPSFL